MSTIRYCQLRDTDVIISPKRLHRPTQLEKVNDYYSLDECPFEAGAESSTPDEIYSIKDLNGDWICRVIPNLYNALDINEEKKSKREGFFTYKNTFGAHEVLIETPSHDIRMSDYSIENWNAYLNTINHRVKDLSNDSRLEYIQVFKNQGFRAGATLQHPHSQILATGFVPREIREEFKRCKQYFDIHQRTLVGDIAHEELSIGKRVIYENNSFVAFAPFASLYPFEIFIVPKDQYCNMNELDQKSIEDLSVILKTIYKKMYTFLGDFHFNMIFKNSIKSEEFYTFYIQIIPRIYMLAGFELSTGMGINPIEPESASKKLRQIL